MSNRSAASQPKVSVIIPIYNTDTYLNEALDSICNQTLKDVEIILINDGSTDNSQHIIEEYTEKYDRIKYRIQTNQGQSVARNNGLLLATGKYIYFMDSDDILKTTALEQCYEICEKEQLDFVTFDAETISENSNSINLFNYCRKGIISEGKLWNGIELLNYELERNVFIVSPWLYFINRSFLKKNFSGFPAGVIHEDHILAMQITLNASHIRYIAQSYFKRRIRVQSTMTNNFNMRNIEGYTAVCTQIRSWAQANEKWSTVIRLYLTGTLNSVIWSAHKMTLLEKMETACRFRRLKFSKYVSLRNWIVFWFK